MAIPKIIHQTYRTEKLPSEIAEIVGQLKTRNTDWEYRFYTDDDIYKYIQSNFDERTLQAYLKINPVYGAAKADLFRYLVLYKEGGVYLDIKSTCVYPLNEVIKPNEHFIITQWQNEEGEVNEGAGLFEELTHKLGIKNGEYQQWFIISEANSPFLKEVVNTVVNNILSYRPWHYKLHSYGKRGVLFVTGPVAYTKAIHSVMDKYPHRFERYDRDLGFVYNALVDQSHTKVLSNHYASYKGPIVRKNNISNLIFNAYILGVRLVKNTLKTFGLWRN